MLCSLSNETLQYHGFTIKLRRPDGDNTINNVAFLIMSSGPNYNLQTRFGNGSHTVWYVTDNNMEITVYALGWPEVDDHQDIQDSLRADKYDDLVKWVTVYELYQKACLGAQTGDEGPLRIITYHLPIAYQNVFCSAEVIAVCGVKFPSPEVYKWDQSFLTNPNGLSLDGSSGVLKITGTPQCGNTTTLHAIVKDSKNNTASRTFNLIVQPDPIIFSPISGTTFYAYNDTDFSTTIKVSGGRPNPTYNPLYQPCNSCYGLNCERTNGTITISGRPNIPSNSSVICTFNVSVTDYCNQTASASYSVVIHPSSDGGGGGGCPPLTLTPPLRTTWSAIVGQPFSQTITVSGGQPPLTKAEWSLTGNCGGLSRSCDSTSATVSGTPTQSGTCTFNVAWKDSCSPLQSIQGTYTINISPSVSCPPLSLNPPSGTQWTANEGSYFYQTINVSGGYHPLQNTMCNWSCSQPVGGPIARCYANNATIQGTPYLQSANPSTCKLQARWRDSCPSGNQIIEGNYTVKVNPSPIAVINGSPFTVYYKLDSDSPCRALPRQACVRIYYGDSIHFYQAQNCLPGTLFCQATYNYLKIYRLKW